MKKSIALIIIIIVIIIVGGFFIMRSNKTKQVSTSNITESNIPQNESTDNKTEEKIDNNKTEGKSVAVIYFSATGNTKQVADLIKEEINADIYEIIPKEKYTSEDLNYGDDTTRATREQKDKNARPEIENSIDVSNYDVIFLGYPIWWGDVPKIILSFMDNTNLDGKTVVPFCTSGSSGISTSENTLKSYNDNINWVKGNRFSGSASKENIKTWIDSLELNFPGQNNVGEISMNEFIIEVNGRDLIVKTENNSSTEALIEKLKDGNVVINANEYGNFEKVGSLGFSLPTNNKQMTTKAGDVVLYQGNSISLFYGTNSWSYTKLGEIENVDEDELKSILGDGNVKLTLKLK